MSRSYEKEDFVYEPRHYLELLEQKNNALDQAAPLQGWELPAEFAQLRRLFEARLGKKGRREYIQISAFAGMLFVGERASSGQRRPALTGHLL